MSPAGAGPLTAGLDLGGTKCLGVAVAPGGEVRAEARRPTPRGAEAILDLLTEVTSDLATRAPGIAAVGVGAPGLVDREGVLRAGPNLPGVVDLAIAETLSARVGLPVVVDNDATAAAWAEHAVGAAKGCDHVVLVTFGTGIGGGIVSDGRLLRGVAGFAGELGHMVIVAGGLPCGCGQRGCWEQYASGSALARLAREAVTGGRAPEVLALAAGDVAAVRGEHVVAAALAGHDEARPLLVELGRWIGMGLSNLVNLLDPEVVVLGGGLVGAGDLLLDPVRDAFAASLYAAGRRPAVPVVPAALGERAGAVGAALLAAHRRHPA